MTGVEQNQALMEKNFDHRGVILRKSGGSLW